MGVSKTILRLTGSLAVLTRCRKDVTLAVMVYYRASQMAQWLKKKQPPFSARDARDMGSVPGSGRSPVEPTPVFWPRESHGQRGLMGYSL